MVSKTKKTKSRSSHKTLTPDSLQKQIKVVLASFFSVEKLLNKPFSQLESKWLSFESYFNSLLFTFNRNEKKIKNIKDTIVILVKELKSTPIEIMNVLKKNTNKVEKSKKKGNKKSFETGYKSRIDSIKKRISEYRNNLQELTSENDSIEAKLTTIKCHTESLKVSYACILRIAKKNNFSNLESSEHEKIPQDTGLDHLINQIKRLKSKMKSFTTLYTLLDLMPSQDEKTELDDYADIILDEHMAVTSTYMLNVVEERKIDYNSLMLIKPLNHALQNAMISVPFLAVRFISSDFFRSFDASFNPFTNHQCTLRTELFINLATLMNISGTQYDHVGKLNKCYHDSLFRLDEMINTQFDQALISKYQSWCSPALFPPLINTAFFILHSGELHARIAFLTYLAVDVIIRSHYKGMRSSLSDLSSLSPKDMSRVLKQTRDNLSITNIVLSMHLLFIAILLLLKYLMGVVLFHFSSEADQFIEKFISLYERHFLIDYRIYSFIAATLLLHNFITEQSNTMPPSLEDLFEQKKRLRQYFDEIAIQLYDSSVLASRHSLPSILFKSPLLDNNTLTSYLVSWGTTVYFTLNVMRALTHHFSSHGVIAAECNLLSNKSTYDQFLFHCAILLTLFKKSFLAGWSSYHCDIIQFCSIYVFCSDLRTLRFFNEVDPKCAEANLIRSLPFYCMAFRFALSIIEMCKAHLDHRESSAGSSLDRPTEHRYQSLIKSSLS